MKNFQLPKYLLITWWNSRYFRNLIFIMATIILPQQRTQFEKLEG